VSVVANVAINVDSRDAVSKLRQVQQGAQATSQAVDKLNATNDALAASFTKSGKPIQTAANGMRYFVDATGRARKENGQFVTTAEAAAAGLQKQGKAAQQAGASVSNFGSTIRGLIGSFAAIQAAKFVFVNAAEIETQTRSLQVLTGSTEKAGQIVKELQDLGAVTPFTSSELIDSAKRLQAFGVETNKVVETTRRLADVSGATGAELQGLVTAYGQVQAKGRLQGEELLQFQERGVALQQVLREEYNLSGEEFQDALEKGRISAQAVEYAIQKLTSAGGKYADGAVAQSDTLAGRLSTLQDAVQNLASRLGSILAPAMQSILGLAIDIANQVNNVFETILLQRQLGANLSAQQRDRLFKQAGQEAEQIAKLRGGGRINADQFTQLREERFRDLMRTYGYQQGILKPPTAAPPSAAVTLPGLMAGTGGKKKTGKSDAEREAERLRKELERSLEVGDQLGTQFARQVVLLDESSELERKRLQIQFDFEDRTKQINELKNEEQRINLTTLSEEIKRLDTLKLQSEELKKQIEEYYKLAGLQAGDPLRQGAGAFRTDIDLGPQNKVATFIQDAQSQLQDLETRAISVAQGIGDAIANSLVGGIQGLIAGTQNAKEVFANFLQSIGQVLAQEGTKMIATYIAIGIARLFAGLGGGDSFGGKTEGLGAKVFGSSSPSFGGSAFGASAGTFGLANGGPVSVGQPYVVGERGPELFLPNTGGNVMSNNDLRSAMGSSSAAAGAPVLNMSFQTTNIGGVEYVSRDQLEQAMAATRRQAASDGAKRGMTMTLDKLQQSPGTRSRVGLR
jgi:tape measure domain-containing protein